MFDTITSRQKRSVARRSSSLAISVFLHGAVIGGAAVATYVKAHLPQKEEPPVVTFRPPPPPPPPPPPAGHKPKTPRQTPKPVTPKAPPRNIIQPKEIPKIEEKPPENIEETPEEDEGVEGGVEGGVIGGVVGGVVGGTHGGQEGPPLLLGQGMSRPQPTSECRPQKPTTPEQARQMGVTGTVLVEYVVHTDGHVGEVVLKNPTAPPILFQAVRSWLENCPFTPSMSGGRPVPVKIIQPFIFKQQ